MRWPTPRRTPMKWICPKDGDERTFTAFAWFPVECEGGTTCWLERVTYYQKYLWLYDMCGGAFGMWVTERATALEKNNG